MRKGAGGDASRSFKLIHQTLCITSIDFQRKCIFGFVELNILPLASNLTRIKLNGKQWIRIYRVCMKEERQRDWLDVGFQFDDPNKTVCQDNKKRNLEYFISSQQAAVAATEKDGGGGEITIKIPKELLNYVSDKRVLQISIEFSLEHPDGGIQFVTPEGSGTLAERSCHMFTCGLANSSRLWFPCVDSYSEVCTWNIDVTVSQDMVCVSCGELTDQVLTPDERRKTYHYVLNIPTAAPNIAVAVGPFVVHVDPVMPEVTHFCLPGLLPALKHSTQFLSEVFEFYEECLSSRYPYTYYKQVFVDQAYMPASSYASMTIFSTNLLHSVKVIDQTFETRQVLAHSLAEQFFGVYLSMQTWADAWLPISISGYLFGLFIKRSFGNNEYRHWIHKEMTKVCQFEIEGPGLPLLYQSTVSSSLSTGGAQASSSRPESPVPGGVMNPAIHQLHPHLSTGTQSDVAKSKAHLVMRMIELRIGQESLLQVYNKLLSLASTAVNTKYDMHTWGNMLISTSGFLKSITTVSGKDINVFVDQWICRSGVAKFLGSFVFNRKRNIVELELKQDMSKGALKYVGPLTVCIQELDGSFNHTVQIEDAVSRHEIPCHSKSRRNKKKKIPLMTGEEVDMNLDAMDSDSPVLWMRIDPEVTWLRHVTFQQPDYMWQYQLRYERDIIAQTQAIDALEGFPTQASRDALTDIINQQECFYKVRLSAIECLAKIATASSKSWTGHQTMISMFRSMFGSTSCPTIVQYNNFNNFVNYYIQKTLPVSIASIRNEHSQCPKEVVQFILDLLKYNDNRLNHIEHQGANKTKQQYSDSHYLSSLIDALAATTTPAVVMATSVSGKVNLTEECSTILSEIMRYLNLEKLLPSYRYSITCSCLKALRVLQKNGHIPSDPVAFKYYMRYGHFEDVRLTAIESLIDLIKVESSAADLDHLLDLIEHDPCPYVRHCAVNMLAENPPFTRKAESPLNTLTLVERLWYMMNSETVSDPRLRCDLVELYNVLWGRVTPSCVPPQGCGIVIDLKEKKIMNLSPLPPAAPSPAQDYFGSMSGDESVTGKKAQKRKSSRPASPTAVDFSSLENQPDTPLSVESTASDGSKLRLKIKIGNEDSGGESGAESVLSRMDSETMAAVMPTLAEHKKHKKKKKKKHKHKDDKSRKLSTSSSNYDSPLMMDMLAGVSVKKEPENMG